MQKSCQTDRIFKILNIVPMGRHPFQIPGLLIPRVPPILPIGIEFLKNLKVFPVEDESISPTEASVSRIGLENELELHIVEAWNHPAEYEIAGTRHVDERALAHIVAVNLGELGTGFDYGAELCNLIGEHILSKSWVISYGYSIA